MMVCRTCRRDDVDAINAMMLKPVALRNIMSRIQDPPSIASLQRHKEKCLDLLFAEVREAKRSGLLAEVDAIRADIAELQDRFPDNGNVLVGLIGKRLEALDKEAKLTGAYQQERSNSLDLQAEIAKYFAQQGVDEPLVRQVLDEMPVQIIEGKAS